MPNPHFRNVTVSGVAGTGTTTLLKGLRDELKPLGWVGYSGGEYMRQFVTTKLATAKHHDSRNYSEDVDRQVDMGIRQELTQQDHLIIESWLSGFMAQGVAGVLKILVVCTDDLARARRLAERDAMQPQEALLHAYERLEANVTRWTDMYAAEWEEWIVKEGLLPADALHNFWNPRLYDLVIDTAAYTPSECLEMSLSKLLQASPA